jgi:hypothetical protein
MTVAMGMLIMIVRLMIRVLIMMVMMVFGAHVSPPCLPSKA